MIIRTYRVLAIIILLSSILLGACAPSADPEVVGEPVAGGSGLSPTEQQRVDLYVLVMREAFTEENGGDGFIAIDLESLIDLSEEAKQVVLGAFDDLSDRILVYADVKDNEEFFVLGTDGSMLGRSMSTKDGAVLSISLEEYKENQAKITGESWFGVLGAVFPEYEAEYKDGAWKLTLISMAIS